MLSSRSDSLTAVLSRRLCRAESPETIKQTIGIAN
jgi:hypothetical protein